MAGNEIAAVRAQLQQERQRNQALETRLVSSEKITMELRKRICELERDRDNLQHEVRYSFFFID